MVVSQHPFDTPSLWECPTGGSDGPYLYSVPALKSVAIECSAFPCEAGEFGSQGLCSRCPEEAPFSPSRATSSSSCTACDKTGTFSHLRECFDCELGHVNPLTNSTSADACIPCEAGTGPTSDRSSCSGCGAGSYSEGGGSTTAAVCTCACERSVGKAHEVREGLSSSSLLP